MFYNCNDVNETRTLKSDGGFISHILVGQRGDAGSLIKVYDGTSAQGTLVTIIDSNKADSWLAFDQEFTTGLTYVTSGGPGNFTIFYK